jgi:hypothetical protein
MRADDLRQLDDLRRRLAAVLGAHIARLLDARGVTHEEIENYFRAHRRRRR